MTTLYASVFVTAIVAIVAVFAILVFAFLQPGTSIDLELPGFLRMKGKGRTESNIVKKTVGPSVKTEKPTRNADRTPPQTPPQTTSDIEPTP